MIIPITHVQCVGNMWQMGGKTASEKRFDRILRRMLQSKPVSRAEISVKVRSRRKTRKASK